MSSSHDRVQEALRSSGSDERNGNWNCPGPLHGRGDLKPGLHVTYDGRGVAFTCHVGCSTEEILAALDLKWADLFDEPLDKKEPHYYKYYSADGEVLYAKLKYQPKRYSIKHPVEGGWEDGIPKGCPRVLYNLPAVIRAVKDGLPVWVCEGEKDCDRLNDMGLVATTNFEGASIGKSKWRPEYTGWLTGAKKVMIVADRDEVGEAHAQSIASALAGKVDIIRILQSKTTGQGHDVSDHLDAGFALDQLVPFRQSEISRKYVAVNWHEAWKSQPDDIEWLKEDFLEKGTLNSLFSKPGIGKSLIALEIALEVVRAGHRVMYVDDENRVSDTVDRLKAYRCTPDELDQLVMYSFQGLPPLDTAEGGIHLDALAAENEPALVIMDTVSRMVEGEENAANTFLQLYRCSLVPLKARGVTVLRLDHSGKYDARGMRGSSAKESDVDFVWKLAREANNHFSLECQKSRNGHIAFGQIIQLQRLYEPLRHVWDVKQTIPLSQYEGIMRQMDILGIPESYGRDRVRTILKENSVVGIRNDQLQAAIIERRNRTRKSFVPCQESVPGEGTEEERPF